MSETSLSAYAFANALQFLRMKDNCVSLHILFTIYLSTIDMTVMDHIQNWECRND